jgi:hypothetical protein
MPAPRQVSPELPLGFDAAVLDRWAQRALDGLSAARSEIDALNVFPVPDGDTGTNLFLTVQAAVEQMGRVGRSGLQAPAGELRRRSADLAHGALLGARGNSGVILSQLLRGFADALPDAATTVDRTGFAHALSAAAESAYSSVAAPVEGTMLTVAREAAQAASRAAQDTNGDLASVVSRAAAAAREALARTPTQLEALRRAGVVDAGGRGVCVVLDALEAVVLGRQTQPQPPLQPTVLDRHSQPQPPLQPTVLDRHSQPQPPLQPTVLDRHSQPQPLFDATSRDRESRGSPRGGADAAAWPAYEVMYLLDAPAAAIPDLRATLTTLGDSLLVAGGEPTWNVHVHVDDAGAAIEAGVRAGRLHRIRVTHLADAGDRAVDNVPLDGRGVVSVAAGGGLAALFEAAGATVVPGGPGRRASTAELLAGIHRTSARHVVVLPNDGDSLAVAQAAAAAARQEGLRVAVVPTRATVQAIAALAVHDPGRTFDEDVLAMTAAAGHCRHGGVTVATRQAVTMAGVCAPGDVLGVIDGDFAVMGSDLAAVACEVVDRMLGGGGELVTLVTGASESETPASDTVASDTVASDTGASDTSEAAASDTGGTTPAATLAPHQVADAVVAHLRRTHPEVDTVVHEGGQPRYPLLVGVE